MKSLSSHHVNYYENSIWPMQQTFKNREQNIFLIINSSPHIPILKREIKVTEEEIAPSYREIHTSLPLSPDLSFSLSHLLLLNLVAAFLLFHTKAGFYSTLTGSCYLKLTASLWELNQLAFYPTLPIVLSEVLSFVGEDENQLNKEMERMKEWGEKLISR